MQCDVATIQRLQAEESRCHDMLEAFYWAESESEYNKQLQVRWHAGVGGRMRRAWPARLCGLACQHKSAQHPTRRLPQLGARPPLAPASRSTTRSRPCGSSTSRSSSG